MSDQALTTWADGVIDAVRLLRSTAGSVMRDPSDQAAVQHADRTAAQLIDLLSQPQPVGAFGAFLVAADPEHGSDRQAWLAGALGQLAPLAAPLRALAAAPDEFEGDVRATVKPVAQWLRTADKETAAWRRLLDEADAAHAASRAEAEILDARRDKLNRLRADGIDPFPYEYAGVVSIAEVRAACAGLESGSETEQRYRVAGRLASRRDQGGMSFLDLYDRSGRIQLQATTDQLDDAAFRTLAEQVDLGDLLGIDGRAFVSRRGELTLHIEAFVVLAKALRPPPDKRHGLRDVEARYRFREVDLIANEQSRRIFIARSRMIAAIRRTLDGDGFLEVETPTLQPLYGGAAAEPFVTHHNALDRRLYLRIAPELYLKRCLVGGLERVYEIGKNFRNEGLSPKHNPEFTAIEWYEAYAEYHQAADRTEAIVAAAAQAAGYDFAADGAFRFDQPWRRVTFVDAVREATGVDLLAHRSDEALRDAVRAHPKVAAQIDRLDELNWPQLADELLGTFVEPNLLQPTFIFDHPVELSPLAKRHRTIDGLTERWEAYVGGMEIANAFSELNDPDEQRARFEAQVRYSEGGDAEAQPYDEGFVRALEHGMPPAAGVGVGIDRLAMILTGQDTIRDVLLFPALKEL
ncbi:MAG: lysine--tRNA ligase [Patulibacter sp.]